MPTNPSQPPDGRDDENLEWGPELREFGTHLISLIRNKVRSNTPAILRGRATTPLPGPVGSGLRQVPDENAEALRDKIEIHGSNVMVVKPKSQGEGIDDLGKLTVDFLYDHGLRPRYAVMADGVPFLLSEPYAKWGRLCVTAYVRDAGGGSYVARTYYLSGSHSVWRHLPGYWVRSGELDKLDDESQIALPGPVQKALGQLSLPKYEERRVSLSEYYARIAFFGTARELGQEAEDVGEMTAHRDVRHGRVTLLDDGEAQPDKKPEDINQALEDKRKRGPYPDVGRVLDSWKQYSSTYGREILVETVPDLFDATIVYRFHSMEYEFHGEKRTAVWLGSGEDTSGRIGSTGLRKGYVHLGNLGAAPFEYYKDNDQTGGYGEEGNYMGNYQGIHANYHDRITLFQEYREALEGRKSSTVGESSDGAEVIPIEGWPNLGLRWLTDVVGRNRSALKLTLAGILALGTVMERGHAPYRHEVVFRPGGESLYRISDRIVENARKKYPTLMGSFGDSYLVRDLMRKAVVDTIITENTRLMREQGQEPFDENFGNIKAGLRIMVNFDPRHHRIALERVAKEVRDATNDAAILGNLTNAELDQRQRLSAFSNVKTAGINPKYREQIEQFIDGRRSYFEAADEVIGRTPFRSETTGITKTAISGGIRARIGYAQESILSGRKTEQTLDIIRDIAPQDSQRQQMSRVRYITLHSTITPTSATAEDSEKTNDALRKTLKDTGHAHYYVDEEGKVYQLYNDKTALNHAGLFGDKRYGAIYQGNGSVTMESIGIEVRAPKGEAWNAKQMEAVRKLISVIGYEHDLTKKDVKRHSEIANAKNSDDAQNGYRGRKSDPVGVDFAQLGLPGHPPIDPDILSGQLGYSTQAKTHPDFALDIAMGDKGIVRTWERSDELYRAIRAANPTHGDHYRQAKPKTEMKAPGDAAPIRAKPVPTPQKPAFGKKSPSNKASPTQKGRPPSRQSTTPPKKPASKAPARRRNRR